MSIELWTLTIAAITSIVCALCGSLLLVNRQSMVSEGLSHAVLPGLVIAFILLRDYNSPWLIISAAASGVLMVWFTQWLHRTGLVDEDAGLGIVFAGMFSVGILIVSRKLRSTHFHADCIIDGNLALAPLDRFEVGGLDLGPKSWVVMLTLLVVICGFIAVCFKELKLTLFDPSLAARFRLKPVFLQMISLSLISLTAVAAFNVAGSVLIVALMIAPPAAACLLTNKLHQLLIVSCVVSIVGAVAGFYLAKSLDVAPNGPIASATGGVFLLVLAFAPSRGLIARLIETRNRRQTTATDLLLETIMNSERPTTTQTLSAGLAWPEKKVTRLLDRLVNSGRILKTADGYQSVAS